MVVIYLNNLYPTKRSLFLFFLNMRLSHAQVPVAHIQDADNQNNPIEALQVPSPSQVAAVHILDVGFHTHMIWFRHNLSEESIDRFRYFFIDISRLWYLNVYAVFHNPVVVIRYRATEVPMHLDQEMKWFLNLLFFLPLKPNLISLLTSFFQ